MTNANDIAFLFGCLNEDGTAGGALKIVEQSRRWTWPE